MKKILLAVIGLASICQAEAAQDWGPMPYPSIVNEPKMTDFTRAARMISETAADPAYVDKFATYRMCTELSLRALLPHKITPVGALVYTAVRGCTRQMDDYVLLYVNDEKYKADYYVAHAIQRLAQQDQIIELLPLASRLTASDGSPKLFTK